METAEGPRQLTHDGVHKSSVDLAPSGNRIVYIAWDEASDVEQRDLPKEDLIEIDVNGLVLRHLTPEGYVHGVTRLEWIDDQRVGAEGSCKDGRDCTYWVLDADSGATLQQFLHGGGFIWSHNRKWIAWRVAGHRPDEGERDGVMLDETWSYPPRDEARQRVRMKAGRRVVHSDAFEPFSWSPRDLWLGFADTVLPERHTFVVLVSPTGVILRKATPVDDYGTTLRIDWMDDTHFQLVTGDRTFTFVVDDTQLREVTAAETK
jgi:hypothetical protein